MYSPQRFIAVILLSFAAYFSLLDVSAFAGKIQPATGQGVVTYKAPTKPNPDAQPGGRVVAPATAQGIVVFRRAVTQCPEGSERVGERCVRACPAQMYRYRGQCRCPEGLVRDGDRCKDKQIVQTCLAPKILRGGQCVLPACPGDTFRSGGKCSCDTGLIRRGNNCERPPQIVIFPSGLPGGIINIAYRVIKFSASEGKRPHRFFVVKGALPPGLNLTTAGRLSGTPTVSGRFAFTVRATDAERFRGSRAYTIVIAKPPQISISPSELPGSRLGDDYTAMQFSAYGGTAPHRFAITSGSLPPGLNVTPSGLLSGKSTQSGTFTFTLQATDAKQFNGNRTYSILIERAPQISISPAELRGGNQGIDYPAMQFSAYGGSAPHRFAITSGSLPPGLNITPSGLLSGKSAQSGTFTFTLQATDAKQYSGNRTYSILIERAPQIAVSPPAIPGGFYDTDYSPLQLAASGGVSPYTFAVANGTLPSGLTMASTGLISGVPVTRGVFNFVVNATDSRGSSGTASYSIAIVDNARPSNPDCPKGMVRFGANCVKDGNAGGGDDFTPPPPRVSDSNPKISNPDREPSNLARPLQKELKRLGCLSGRVDGVWGSGSRAALSKFVRKSGLRLNRSDPTASALRAARSKRSGYCKPTSCRRGFIRNRGGECIRKKPTVKSCGSNQYRNDNRRCVCRGGYEKRGGRCKRIVEKPRCPANSYRSKNGQCNCKQGYQPSGNRCIRVAKKVTCPPYSYRNGRQCVCNKGYQPRGNKCVQVQRQEGSRNSEGGGYNRQCKKRRNKCAVRAVGCMFKYNNERLCEQQARKCLGSCI